MNRMTKNAQAVMTGEKTAGPLLKLLLMILSTLYGIAVRLRAILFDHGVFQSRTLPCGVISIGNLTVGGTGKTPMTIYLAERLKEFGFKPAVISRGYKGQAENKGGIVSDGHNILLGPDIAGDEPFMMAQRLKDIPVLVGADRFQIGMKAVEKFCPDVIIFDDAFQHRRLNRDLDIVLVDDKSLFGNRYLLPRGILREPVSGLSRGDLFVLTRCDNSNRSFDSLSEMAPGKPIFKSFHEPYMCGIFNGTDCDFPGSSELNSSQDYEFLKMSKVFVFSGIAKNEEFLRTVKALAGAVVGMIPLDDHHKYTETDYRLIVNQARKCSAEFLVTTEKDYVKVAGKIQSPMDIVVVGIRVSFKHDEMKFSEFIKEKVDASVKSRCFVK
ncbi:MAG: tetraacyldisaccharide 4'-kinase [Desulfobacteraceae bacterium]|nr:tetraacyldisaccharide 4'-kinase [Desulfobacteraceae bacterium]MBC2755303.1 tetraacyldisaccharide 4'-kinase [Desulfobacteraceae bacterium]